MCDMLITIDFRESTPLDLDAVEAAHEAQQAALAAEAPAEDVPHPLLESVLPGSYRGYGSGGTSQSTVADRDAGPPAVAGDELHVLEELHERLFVGTSQTQLRDRIVDSPGPSYTMQIGLPLLRLVSTRTVRVRVPVVARLVRAWVDSSQDFTTPCSFEVDSSDTHCMDIRGSTMEGEILHQLPSTTRLCCVDIPDGAVGLLQMLLEYHDPGHFSQVHPADLGIYPVPDILSSRCFFHALHSSSLPAIEGLPTLIQRDALLRVLAPPDWTILGSGWKSVTDAVFAYSVHEFRGFMGSGSAARLRDYGRDMLLLASPDLTVQDVEVDSGIPEASSLAIRYVYPSCVSGLDFVLPEIGRYVQRLNSSILRASSGRHPATVLTEAPACSYTDNCLHVLFLSLPGRLPIEFDWSEARIESHEPSDSVYSSNFIVLDPSFLSSPPISNHRCRSGFLEAEAQQRTYYIGMLVGASFVAQLQIDELWLSIGLTFYLADRIEALLGGSGQLIAQRLQQRNREVLKLSAMPTEQSLTRRRRPNAVMRLKASLVVWELFRLYGARSSLGGLERGVESFNGVTVAEVLAEADRCWDGKSLTTGREETKLVGQTSTSELSTSTKVRPAVGSRRLGNVSLETLLSNRVPSASLDFESFLRVWVHGVTAPFLEVCLSYPSVEEKPRPRLSVRQAPLVRVRSQELIKASGTGSQGLLPYAGFVENPLCHTSGETNTENTKRWLYFPGTVEVEIWRMRNSICEKLAEVECNFGGSGESAEDEIECDLFELLEEEGKKFDEEKQSTSSSDENEENGSSEDDSESDVALKRRKTSAHQTSSSSGVQKKLALRRRDSAKSAASQHIAPQENGASFLFVTVKGCWQLSQVVIYQSDEAQAAALKCSKTSFRSKVLALQALGISSTHFARRVLRETAVGGASAFSLRRQAVRDLTENSQERAFLVNWLNQKLVSAPAEPDRVVLYSLNRVLGCSARKIADLFQQSRANPSLERCCILRLLTTLRSLADASPGQLHPDVLVWSLRGICALAPLFHEPSAVPEWRDWIAVKLSSGPYERSRLGMLHLQALRNFLVSGAEEVESLLHVDFRRVVGREGDPMLIEKKRSAFAFGDIDQKSRGPGKMYLKERRKEIVGVETSSEDSSDEKLNLQSTREIDGREPILPTKSSSFCANPFSVIFGFAQCRLVRHEGARMLREHYSRPPYDLLELDIQARDLFAAQKKAETALVDEASKGAGSAVKNDIKLRLENRYRSLPSGSTLTCSDLGPLRRHLLKNDFCKRFLKVCGRDFMSAKLMGNSFVLADPTRSFEPTNGLSSQFFRHFQPVSLLLNLPPSLPFFLHTEAAERAGVGIIKLLRTDVGKETRPGFEVLNARSYAYESSHLERVKQEGLRSRKYQEYQVYANAGIERSEPASAARGLPMSQGPNTTEKTLLGPSSNEKFFPIASSEWRSAAKKAIRNFEKALTSVERNWFFTPPLSFAAFTGNPEEASAYLEALQPSKPMDFKSITQMLKQGDGPAGLKSLHQLEQLASIVFNNFKQRPPVTLTALRVDGKMMNDGLPDVEKVERSWWAEWRNLGEKLQLESAVKMPKFEIKTNR